jgi:ATP-dependent RNA helicase DDX24/MAK5
MAFANPTPCQAACIPKILRGKDVVCAAQTGSGKTLAFALPALHDALANSTGVRSLVLAPTRELARQIAQHCVNALPRSVDAKRLVCCIVGGLAEQKQERQLALAPSIVVATPGRARELIEDGKASTVAKALEERTLRFLILDEADRLLAPGAFADFTLLTKRYLVDHAERPRKRWQTLVFSATLACGSTQPRDKKRERQTDADPRALLKAVEPLRSPTRKLEVVDLTSRKEEDADDDEEDNVALPSTLTLEAVRVVDAAKLATCYALLRGGSSKGKTVVFTNAISSVKTVASALQKLQIPRVVALHAALQQRQRLRALDAFEKHDDAVLVASCVENDH